MSGLKSFSEEERRERTQYLSRASFPLGKLAFLRLITIIILVGVLIISVFAFIMELSYWNYSDRSSGFYNLSNFTIFLLGLGNIIVTIIFILKLKELSSFDSRFMISMIFCIASIITDFISNLVPIPLIAIILSIISCISSIIFVYHFYGALADLTAGQNNKLSDTWNMLFKVYLAITILSGILTAYGLFAHDNLETITVGTICIMIVSVLEIVLLIVEYIFLRKTAIFFEDIRSDVESQGRFDDSDYQPQQWFSNKM